ncbi:ATP-binding protein [Dickeya zeae]|uniref:ATP-binding protein n=1 Tax=Dickeya zeae TaxID=204042 RepID=UPI00037B737E|nr:ATP-binding protein [Dickeya zeae]UJR55195.1 hypothetical protein J417_14755 [Dickeya zeae MS1]
MTSQKRKTTNTDKSILGQIDNFSPAKAINEYIWNAFDAKAKNVSIDVSHNGLSGISLIKITDDGEGISHSELANTFDKFLDSKKVIERTPTTRGRKGKGRFSFIKFADRANWLSWMDGKEFTIDLVSSHVNEYDVGEFLPSDKKNTGTEVSFSPVTLAYDSFWSDVKPYIQNDVSWLLVSDEKYRLTINGVATSPIEHTKQEYSESIDSYSFKIKTVQWSTKPVYEKSYIYFMNSHGDIVYKELSEMNRKGFHCSAYVTSDWFDTFDMDNSLLNGDYHSHESESYKYISAYVKKCLKDEYLIFKSSVADQLIKDYLEQGVFPVYSGDNKMLNDFKRSQLIETIKVIYEAEPALFSNSLNIKQKKILVKLLDRIVETNNLSNLFDIFEGIIELNNDEIDKLSEVIRRTSLSNITKTISFINDRLDVLDYFKKLLKDENKDTYEVKHIQKCIEDNLWLFGEQYTLLASEEDKFDKALRAYLSHINGFDEQHYDKYSVIHPDSKKEMDIFAALKGKRINDKNEEYFHCVVIELKRPSVKLTDKEFSQIKEYKNVIGTNSDFNGDNTHWDFILVGNEISNSQITAANIRDEIENSRAHGEFGLAQKSGTKKIYIKTWKQIINEFEIRYHDLTEKLKVKELLINESNPNELTSEIRKLSGVS